MPSYTIMNCLMHSFTSYPRPGSREEASRRIPLRSARRPIRPGARGIEIGPGIDANAEPIDQFTAELTRHQRR